MRTQKVSVDVWKMIFSSCSYLGLACAAWVLIKLVYACFWLPKYLKTEEEKEKEKKLIEEMEKLIAEEEALELKRNQEVTESDEDEEDDDDDDEDPFQDKKND